MEQNVRSKIMILELFSRPTHVTYASLGACIDVVCKITPRCDFCSPGGLDL